MKSKFGRFSRGQSLEAPTIPDAHRFGHCFKIIFRRNLCRMIWKHSLVFLICYFSLTVLYNFGLNEKQMKNFEALTSYLARYTRTFNWMIMLGFFTNTALQRLFTTQMTIPGTARITTLFTMSLKPNLPEGPAIVELYARWTILAWILTFRIICHPLRREFPNLQAIQDSVEIDWHLWKNVLALLKVSIIHKMFCSKLILFLAVVCTVCSVKGCPMGIDRGLEYNSTTRQATTNKPHLWPNGIVPYQISEHYS